MQVTIDARNLRPFTRALTCISKYGDEMMIHAGADGLSLSALNLAKTAYCSFTYRRSFFQKYSAPRATQSSSGTAGPSRTNGHASTEGGELNLKCQIQTKPLLSILKHRNTDKTVEKCDLIIIDGVETPADELRENEDSFESRLIVRLHCRHGIVKTHRLLLNTPASDEAPMMPSSEDESRIIVQARAMKEIIEHFPNSKGTRSDPELIWSFDGHEVDVKSVEKGIDAKGKSQLATKLKLGADEFDYYSVPTAPLTLGFFLREFNATISLTDALNVPIDFRFTSSVQPICMTAESDGCNMLFIIATNPACGQDSAQREGVGKSQPNGAANGAAYGAAVRSASGIPAARKRSLEVDTASGQRSMRVQPAAPFDSASQRKGRNSQQDVNFDTGGDADMNDLYDYGPGQSQPLFLASQLSAAQVDALRESGLGIENMNAEEFAAMLDGEGEEVGLSASPPARTNPSRGGSAQSQVESGSGSMRDELEHDELNEDIEMGPTQLGKGHTPLSEKAFRPLFED